MAGELWGLCLRRSVREPPSDERRSNLDGLSGSGAGGSWPQRRAGGVVSALIGVTVARCRIELASGDGRNLAGALGVRCLQDEVVRSPAHHEVSSRKGRGTGAGRGRMASTIMT